ncbi:divergent protein kinase domain 1A-like [Aplysia californica]|uniref:Divergent protein kinase domain 1A-like n=1 Tax=Aplysia californica TaxID=6500 RepID=A0ABM0K375_APLCA|nr:divergent protein kinase domain 1A-like [Aplysia californica]
MKLRLRLKWKYALRQFLARCLAYFLLGATLCQRYIYAVLCVCGVSLLLLWASYESTSCRTLNLPDSLCAEYARKDVAGTLCEDVCQTITIDTDGCVDTSQRLLILQKGMNRLVMTDTLGHPHALLEEGYSVQQFLERLRAFVRHELGEGDHSVLIKRLFKEFDRSGDGMLQLGEAQSLWRLLRQPYFLSFFIFQDSPSVPYLNGTCGQLTVWHEPYNRARHVLYRRASPWPLSMFSDTAYRWTLPSWMRRAKVVMSLLELVEEMYEKEGVRYHLCHMDGLTLHMHPKDFEVLISHNAMLLSARQVQNRLSNMTCRRHSDCYLTEQCQTSCDYQTGRCTDSLVRPTLSFVCEIMEEYLLFDTPKQIKANLTRLIRRCVLLGRRSASIVTHSVLLIDLKNVIWNFIQYAVVK